MGLVRQEGGNYTYITGAATTVITQKRCILEQIIVNKALTGTVKIIDGGSGTTANVGILTNGATAPLGSVTFNLICNNGLSIVNSATEDITVVWR